MVVSWKRVDGRKIDSYNKAQFFVKQNIWLDTTFNLSMAMGLAH